jgi:hypothetical protein
MTTLAQLRSDLAAVIGTEEVPAFPRLPGRLSPPCLVIEAGSPYLTDDAEGLVFGEHRVTFQVTAVVRYGAPESQGEALDALICHVLEAVAATDSWFVRAVEQPYALTGEADQASLLATTVQITTDAEITKE